MTDIIQLRNPDLDDLVINRGFFLEFYDPAGVKYGFPTFPYRCAPDGLATIRQLRDRGLRPGGQPVVAQILWRHRKRIRVAYLYRVDRAKQARLATLAQLGAIQKALKARRTCPTCKHLRDYYIPRRIGECLDCCPGGTP
jgi:hypothetical protein